MSDVKRITHHINGAYWTGSAERSGDVYNPATGKVTGKVDFASVAVVDQAIEFATRAQAEWRNASLAKRVQVLFAFREILNARKVHSPTTWSQRNHLSIQFPRDGADVVLPDRHCCGKCRHY